MKRLTCLLLLAASGCGAYQPIRAGYPIPNPELRQLRYDQETQRQQSLARDWGLAQQMRQQELAAGRQRWQQQETARHNAWQRSMNSMYGNR